MTTVIFVLAFVCSLLMVLVGVAIAVMHWLVRENRNAKGIIAKLSETINEARVNAGRNAVIYEMLRAEHRERVPEFAVNRAVLAAFNRLVPGLLDRLALIYAAYREQKDEAERAKLVAHVSGEFAHLLSGAARLPR